MLSDVRITVSGNIGAAGILTEWSQCGNCEYALKSRGGGWTFELKTSRLSTNTHTLQHAQIAVWNVLIL